MADSYYFILLCPNQHPKKTVIVFYVTAIFNILYLPSTTTKSVQEVNVCLKKKNPKGLRMPLRSVVLLDVIHGRSMRSMFWLTGRFTEQLKESHSLKQSIAEFVSSSSAHLERIPVLHQQLGGEVYPGKLLCHRLSHQLSHRLCSAGPGLAHHESKVTSHSGTHHVQNPAEEGRNEGGKFSDVKQSHFIDCLTSTVSEAILYIFSDSN